MDKKDNTFPIQVTHSQHLAIVFVLGVMLLVAAFDDALSIVKLGERT